MGIASNRLIVMLDAPRILANEVLAELTNHLGARLVVSPGSGFAVAYDTGIGVNADEEVAVGEDGFDFGDFHFDRRRALHTVTLSASRSVGMQPLDTVLYESVSPFDSRSG